jgi:hypothetical protein
MPRLKRVITGRVNVVPALTWLATGMVLIESEGTVDKFKGKFFKGIYIRKKEFYTPA